MRLIVSASAIATVPVLFAMNILEEESTKKTTKVPLCEAVFVMEMEESEKFSDKQSDILEYSRTESEQNSSENDGNFSNKKQKSYVKKRRSSIDMYYDAYAKPSKKGEEKLKKIKEGKASR